MKINIGSGLTKKTGYITVDIDPNSAADHVLDLEKDSLPFPDNTVEVIMAHHVLEHLGEGFFHCLQEIYRVSKPGALLDIVVPHPRHDAFLADPTHRRPITVMTMQLFSRKFNALCVERQWPSSRLGESYNVDFEILDFNYRSDEKAQAMLSSMNKQQLQDYADHHNNIISEIQIRLIAIKNAK
jgi:ubiquinone/menaquinone biosynthesis C-methylase UbiE